VTGVELHVADLAASIACYETLGFRIIRRWEDWVRLDRDGAELVLQGDAYIRGHEHYFTPHIDRSPRGTGVEVTGLPPRRSGRLLHPRYVAAPPRDPAERVARGRARPGVVIHDRGSCEPAAPSRIGSAYDPGSWQDPADRLRRSLPRAGGQFVHGRCPDTPARVFEKRRSRAYDDGGSYLT
jgi:catechol 2,3-dioxygenase-like lactoylglutathione lyase family enzyme